MNSVDFEYPHFIEEYTIPDEVCDDIINVFEENKSNATVGNFGTDGWVNKDIKDSIDFSVWPQDFNEKLGSYRPYILKFLQDYIEKNTETLKSNWGPVSIMEGTNIQWYPKGGGYKIAHVERDSFPRMHRELVFMTYLTNTPNGGTHFPNYGITKECVKGKTLIWPAGFTHVHHGVVSETHEKMIITGWFSFYDETKTQIL
jgi:prolyl 4-hydroxylase